jgi:metallo-beta-lactamase class B
MGRHVGAKTGLAAISLAALGLAACETGPLAVGYSIATFDNWNYEPFEIAPGIYYVGASGTSVFALESGGEIALVDAGYRSTAEQVLKNLKTICEDKGKLCLDRQKVKYILSTHAHFDHAAGIAYLQKNAGADIAVVAGEDSMKVLESGGRTDEVWLFRTLAYYARVNGEILPLAGGKSVTIGSMEITAHHTPGHADGCTGWSFIAMDGSVQINAYIDCSLTSAFYSFANKQQKEQMRADFEASFKTVRDRQCNLLLAPHPWMFDLDAKRKAQKQLEAEGKTGPNPFVAENACNTYADGMERKFRERLK